LRASRSRRKAGIGMHATIDRKRTREKKSCLCAPALRGKLRASHARGVVSVVKFVLFGLQA